MELSGPDRTSSSLGLTGYDERLHVRQSAYVGRKWERPLSNAFAHATSVAVGPQCHGPWTGNSIFDQRTIFGPVQLVPQFVDPGSHPPRFSLQTVQS